jgi:hypothetical protein
VRIELLTLDQGHLSYADEALDIDLQTDLNTDQTGVLFAVTGTYQGLPLSGSGTLGPGPFAARRVDPVPAQGRSENRRHRR